MKQSKMKSMLSRCGMAAPVGMAAGLLMLLSVATAQAQTCVAPTVLPSCAAGEVLTSRGGALSCVPSSGGVGGGWNFSKWNGIEKVCAFNQRNISSTPAKCDGLIGLGDNSYGGFCAKVVNGQLFWRLTLVGNIVTDTGWVAWTGAYNGNVNLTNFPALAYGGWDVSVVGFPTWGYSYSTSSFGLNAIATSGTANMDGTYPTLGGCAVSFP